MTVVGQGGGRMGSLPTESSSYLPQHTESLPLGAPNLNVTIVGAAHERRGVKNEVKVYDAVAVRLPPL